AMLKMLATISLGLSLTLGVAGRAMALEEGWFLRELPATKPPKEMTVSADETAKIRELIRSLASVAHPDVGYCSTVMGGDIFAPLPNLDSLSGWTMAPENRQRSAALTKLVEHGPRALPFLLEALGDKTPTKLTLGLPFPRADDKKGAAGIDKALWGISLVEVQAPDDGMEATPELDCN